MQDVPHHTCRSEWMAGNVATVGGWGFPKIHFCPNGPK
jgi:hypothetical protein